MGPPGRAWRLSRCRRWRVTFFSRSVEGSPVSADENFREEFRAWLTEHPPPVLTGRTPGRVPRRSRSLPGIEFASTPEDVERLRAWHRTLHAGRWVGIHWPEEYGGRGASVLQVAIYNQEL